MAKRFQVYSGMNRRDAFAEAHRLGCEVYPKTGTGETIVSYPGAGHVVVNGRRKDASRKLTVYLRRVARYAVRPQPQAVPYPRRIA